MRIRKHSGFTLLEMSIVLVIIALVAGGIFVGKGMIANAQLRAAISEYDRYLKAMVEFRDKYNAIPGDMTNAIAMWGERTTQGQPCEPSGKELHVAVATNSPATCNGNGDGRIGSANDASLSSGLFNGLSADGVSYVFEIFLAWQHMANAGLIEGKYTGATASNTSFFTTVGLNIPGSQVRDGGWTISDFHNAADNSYMWGDQEFTGHVMMLGAYHYAAPTVGALLTGSEALEIDTKLDDGRPGMGKIRTWRPNMYGNSDCTINTTRTTMAYRTNNSKVACSLIFQTGL